MDLTDPSAFARVYDEHSPSVYRAAYGIVRDATMAQDVTQDVFLRLWRRPRTFDAGRGEIGSYLRLMARSRALDLWREGQAAGRAGDRLRLVTETQERRPDDLPPVAVERDHDRAEVREALRELPSVQREAIVLAYWGGLTAHRSRSAPACRSGPRRAESASGSAAFATCCRCSRRPPDRAIRARSH